jgi:5-methylthioadenosine/S-adenosylhomocysteine deaminase
MPTIYCARWVLPISAAAINDGGVLVDRDLIAAVGSRTQLIETFPDADVRLFGDAVILPGLINAHSHLELTAMRGYLDHDEGNFLNWLKKLTLARLERMTAEDLYNSALWGACEAIRSGITCVGDASSAALQSMRALQAVGLRGVVFQESFGPDSRVAEQNVATLKDEFARIRKLENGKVRAGVSPHSPYTVSAPQLRLIADFALKEDVPVMMHAAESAAEDLLLREGKGLFAIGLAARGIEWKTPAASPIQYLKESGILQTQPLLAHCIRVDDQDIETIAATSSSVVHCPKSNSRLGHGRAPLRKFLDKRLKLGLGSDSVASNNNCDLLEEARFATLLARLDTEDSSVKAQVTPEVVLNLATMGGARCLRLEDQVGDLKVGKQADLAIVSLEGVHQLPSYEPQSTLVFASSGRDVILTMIAGTEVFRDGQVLTVDEKELRTRVKSIAQKLQ